jgi:hypothetical protein
LEIAMSAKGRFIKSVMSLLIAQSVFEPSLLQPNVVANWCGSPYLADGLIVKSCAISDFHRPHP